MSSIPGRPALGLTETPLQWVLRDVSPAVKQSGLRPDRSPPCSAEVKNAWIYTSTPPHVFNVMVIGYTLHFTSTFSCVTLIRHQVTQDASVKLNVTILSHNKEKARQLTKPRVYCAS
jgi:hypothetical protein